MGKLEEDQQQRRYFGHTVYCNISTLQTLNHLHWICTHKYIKPYCEDEDNYDDDVIEKIKNRNGKKSKFAFHHKFKMGPGSNERKLQVESVPNFEDEADENEPVRCQVTQVIKPRPFRKREREKWREKNVEVESEDVLYWDDLYWPHAPKESMHLLKNDKWERPLSSLTDRSEEQDVFDLTSFDVAVLGSMEIETDID